MFVEAPTDLEYDLDRASRSRSRTLLPRRGREQLGFTAAEDGRLEVGGAYLLLEQGEPAATERPLLNHLGVLVDSVEKHQEEAEELASRSTSSSTRRTRSRSSSGGRSA